MKLKSILKTQSIESLQHLEDHWDIAPVDVSETANEEDQRELLIGNLYQRMQNRNAWDTATRDITPAEKDLINFLTIHGGDLEAGETCQRFFDGDRARMEKAVASLAHRGLVFTDRVPGLSDPLDLVGIPEPFLRYVELPSYWEGYLGHFLKELSNNELKHIATQGLRLQPESANKNYLIHIIRTALLDPKFLRRYLDRLAEGPKSVFQSLQERKGIAVYRDLLELNIQRRYDHSRGDAIQWLLNTSGLVFTVVPGANKYNNRLMIPRDIMYVLTNHFQPDERTFAELDSVSVVEKEQKPGVILDNSTTLLRDIVVFCLFVDRWPVRVLATGGIGKNDLKKVMPQLSRYKTLKYAEFLSLFLIEKKLLVSTGETYKVADSFYKWIEDSQGAYQDMITWWLTTNAWNEEYAEGNTLHIDPRPTGLLPIVPFRKIVLEALFDMPQDRWLLDKGFFEEVLPRIRQDIPHRNDPLQYDKHSRSNELVIESIMGECLHWLGLLGIGLLEDKDAELLGLRLGDGKTMKARGGSRGRPRKQKQLEFTFRFTDLGRFVFSRPLERWPEVFRPEHVNEVLPLKFDVESFILQPTHEVIVPPDLALPTFARLNEMAHVKSIDVASILAMNKHSIRDGLDRGLTGGEILEFLTEHSRTPVPESLRMLVEECAEKHGEVNMGHAGGYIVIDDEMVLSQVKSSKKLQPNIKAVLPGGVVILSPDTDVKRLSRELQKIGFMPRLENEHVTVRGEDTINLSLPKEDMVRLVAALRFTMEAAVDDKGHSVADERLSPLLERMKADPRAFAAINDHAEPLLSTWRKALSAATERRVESVQTEYKEKLTTLVTSSVGAGTTASRFTFSGPNPAEEMDDVRDMLDFAIENEHEVTIRYLKVSQDEVEEVILPKSLERERLYAHCRTRDQSAVYRIDRIQWAKLV
ncbi:MAG: helicase-associated domain-containing protein [Sumerlaeia bacterium]